MTYQTTSRNMIEKMKTISQRISSPSKLTRLSDAAHSQDRKSATIVNRILDELEQEGTDLIEYVQTVRQSITEANIEN